MIIFYGFFGLMYLAAKLFWYVTVAMCFVVYWMFKSVFVVVGAMVKYTWVNRQYLANLLEDMSKGMLAAGRKVTNRANKYVRSTLRH